MSLYEKMRSVLDENRSRAQYRTVVSKAQNGSHIAVEDREYINLSSNDYLGLGSDLHVCKMFLDSLDGKSLRMSSSGSPLLTGAHESYSRALSVMEKLMGKKALFYNSGFAANSGVISALSAPDTLIIADKLSHASIIDGMMSSKGKCLRFAHNDYEHLESLIEKNHTLYDSVIVVTEALFSMDGDFCDIQRLCQIKQKYQNVYLYVDEAHSFCVYGDRGQGLCYLKGCLDKVDFVLTTFGKGLGSQGACILCNETARDYLINTSRSLIFSTALSPFSFEHAAFMLEYMQHETNRRERLEKISRYIHEKLYLAGFEDLSSSQIIPLLTYDNEKALKASEFFKEKGFYAMPIRHPTVPLGKARLRLSLSAFLSDMQVEQLADTIEQSAQLYGTKACL
ncbi:MAG: aminotransferase class I/II-fold pyridoxal phosphate-dependent enzyme [Succinivibrio sp.]